MATGQRFVLGKIVVLDQLRHSGDKFGAALSSWLCRKPAQGGAYVRGRRIFILAFLAIAGAVASLDRAMAAGESLALPFTCSIVGDHIRLAPSGERQFPIIGARQERVVLACAKGAADKCRTMVAHSFQLSCGGKAVSWVRMAEAIGGRRTSRVWRTGDKLHISLVEAAEPATPSPIASAEASSDPCGSRIGSSAEGAAGSDKAAPSPCAKAPTSEVHFVMPPGFAPVSHFGARIVSAAAATASVASKEAAETPPQRPRVVIAAATPIAAPAAPAGRHLLERTIISEPLPEIVVDRSEIALAGSAAVAGADQTGSIVRREGDVVQAVAAAASDNGAAPARMAWTTTVLGTNANDFASSGAAKSASASNGQPRTAIWLLLASLLVSAAWIGWSRQEQLMAVARRLSGSVKELSPERVPLARISATLRSGLASLSSVARKGGLGTARQSNPLSALELAHRNVAMIVAGVPATAPVRRVLDEGVMRVRQRMAAAKSDAGVAVASDFATSEEHELMQELERIRRMAEDAYDNAAVHQVVAKAPVRVPQTREEALKLLGLTGAHANEASIGKIGDALRMSWHPDLAHDAADRNRRLERIAQIDAALKLLTTRSPRA